MEAIEYLINLDRDRNKDKDIDKDCLDELKKDLILKTIRIDGEIKNTKDYVCKTGLKAVMNNLLIVIRNIQELENYLEE